MNSEHYYPLLYRRFSYAMTMSLSAELELITTVERFRGLKKNDGLRIICSKIV